MQFKSILTNLSMNYDIVTLSNQQSDSITDIQLLDAHTVAFDNRVLYIGDVQTIDPNIVLPAQLISTTQLPSSRSTPENYVQIKSADFASIFNYIQHLYYETLQLSTNFSQLISMSIRGDHAQQIINSAAEKLKNPLIVIDSGFKVLLYSNNLPISDPLWIDNIARGYCTYEFITAVNEIMAATIAPDNSTAYELTCPASPKSKLCSKIFWNNSHIGYTVMIEEDTPLNLLQQELLPNISYVMSDVLSKNPSFSGLHGSLKSILLYHLLDNSQPESIVIRMKASKIKAPSRMCCLVASCNTLSDTNQWEQFTQEQLSRIYPHAFITPYNGYIVALIPLEDDFHMNEQQKEKLVQLLPKVSPNFYQSQTFTDIFSCRTFYDQCIFLHNLSIKLDLTALVLQYDQYAYYDLLSHYSNTEELARFISPALQILQQYDLKNNSSLYHTLETYIQCQYNATRTSAALYIHRNSFTYRIKKIEELTQVDLSDSNQLFHITSSYYINNYLS